MGRSSGGGGSAGTVDYPAYMKTRHGAWLDKEGVDTLTVSSLTALLNSRQGASPFATALAFNPATEVAAMLTALTTLGAAVSALPGADLSADVSAASGWASTIVAPEAQISALVSAHSTSLQNELTDRVLPEYLTQMRDMGLVNSSSFAIGEALLWGRKAQEVSRFDAEVRARFADKRIDATLEMVRLAKGGEQLKVDQQRALTSLEVETRRVRIVALKEQNDQNISYDEADSRWAFELYAYAGNLLASIQGAASSPGQGQPSPVQSALGGALAGASIGAMSGQPIGMAIGGGVGAAAGLLGII